MTALHVAVLFAFCLIWAIATGPFIDRKPSIWWIGGPLFWFVIPCMWCLFGVVLWLYARTRIQPSEHLGDSISRRIK